MDLVTTRFDTDDDGRGDDAIGAGRPAAPDTSIAGLLRRLADLAPSRLIVDGPALPPPEALWVAAWRDGEREDRLALSRRFVANLLALRCGGLIGTPPDDEPGALERALATRIAALAGGPAPELRRAADLGVGWLIAGDGGPLGELWRDVRRVIPEPAPDLIAARRAAERDRLARTPLEVRVEVATLRLPLSRLQSLAVGATLPLLAVDRLTLACGARTVARAAHVDGTSIRTVRVVDAS
jgi:hypothetical protein